MYQEKGSSSSEFDWSGRTSTFYNRYEALALKGQTTDEVGKGPSGVVGPPKTAPDEDGHLTNRNRDKAEEFNAFFGSVFNADDGPRGSQYPQLEDHDCKNDELPVNPEIVRNLLLLLDPYKFIGPGGIHPRIFKELADVITKPLDDF
ncbi:hypothetical protein BTVI_77768 [Pitangus sulphuratus]|nr:hypothetical protein BTVI_77768 [Pitangus sulphuratus]